MNASTSDHGLALPALNGANPLGFLAALGTLVMLRKAGNPDARLSWRQQTHWVPVIDGLVVRDEQKLAEAIAAQLHGNKVTAQADTDRESSQRQFDGAKKALKDKLAEIKKRKLKGAARAAVFSAEVLPLEGAMKEKRTEWLIALKKAVPSEELALGKHIDCTPAEFRDHASAFISGASNTSRFSIDLLAAFGSDAVTDKYGRIGSTPFCFITGSGHQYFLDTVRLLIEQATAERVHQALFVPWEYRDEKLSMRWDPAEDRRYPLMDRDPTASDNKSRTVWMANLLAYRSLVLFPSTATARHLGTTGWIETEAGPAFTWPIWEEPLPPEVIQTLLQLEELKEGKVNHAQFRERGVVAAFRSRRIQVGNPPLHKINFTPAQGL